MKTPCPECDGTGHITCDNCNGFGEDECDIMHIKLTPDMPHYNQLIELRRDAVRLRHQADELKRLMPARANSYENQFEAAMKAVCYEVEMVLTDGEGNHP